MSIVTKVFLIVVVILSIALSTLSIAANSMSQNWKKAADDWKASALAASANERATTVQARLTHEQDLDKIGNLSNEKVKLQAELAKLQQELDAKTIEFGTSQGQATALTANLTGLQEQLKLVGSQFAREREFNGTLSKRNAELERRNSDLNDRVKELTTALAMANTQVRALQQQISGSEGGSTSAGIQSYGATSGSGVVEAFKPSVQPMAPSVTAAIRGRVTSVRGNVAGISVGSADGVMPGMKFLVYREAGSATPQYLGTVQITHVEANESAGTVLRTSGTIQTGDTATDEASMAMRR